jgi:transcriptional regulator with XRE-family HTH domain
MALRTKMDFEVELLRRGLSRRGLGADLGVTDQAVCNVINGKSRSPEIRAHIAEKLGVPLGRLARALDWPDAPGKHPAAPASEPARVA